MTMTESYALEAVEPMPDSDAIVRESPRRSVREFAAAPASPFLEALLRASPDCICLIERDDSLGYMNGSGRRAMEFGPDDPLEGRDWVNLWPEEGRGRMRDNLAAAREGRESRFEAFGPTAGGVPRWWEVSLSPLPAQGGAGRSGRVVSIGRDITERVGRRRGGTGTQASSDDARLRIREVDHRVKNSLAIIDSLLRLQRRTMEEGEARDALSRAAVRVRTVAGMHERLHRADAYDTLDAGEYLRALCADLEATGGAADVRLTCDAAALGTLRGEDAVAVGLAVCELVLNAMRHARVGERTCNIAVSCAHTADGRRALTVEDDGCGLPDGFDPKAARGLGMRVVLGNAARLGGDLAIERPEGGGTRFVLRF